MSRSSDSSSSASSEKYKRRQLSKKHKKKSDKKHKRSKHKKRSKRRNSSTDGEPSVKVSRTTDSNVTQITDNAIFGPVLPPDLCDKTPTETSTRHPIIGPVIPNHFKPHTATVPCTEENEKIETSEVDDDMDGSYGPLPVPHTCFALMNSTQIELEERALKLKLAAIDGTGTDSNLDQTVREEWMLELPEVGLKGGLAALSNMKRTFHQGKERPDFTDRSSWTKTPQGATQKLTNSKTNAILKSTAEAKYERERDADQERIAKKHKKKHKREESLVELHQRKLRKEQKEKEKELAASGAKPERRPFSRDVDLKLNKIDRNQTKQIVDKAKILDSKFSGGQKKYL